MTAPPYSAHARDFPPVVSLLLNIVWFVLAGWWLALQHVFLAVGLAITLIGAIIIARKEIRAE